MFGSSTMRSLRVLVSRPSQVGRCPLGYVKLVTAVHWCTSTLTRPPAKFPFPLAMTLWIFNLVTHAHTHTHTRTHTRAHTFTQSEPWHWHTPDNLRLCCMVCVWERGGVCVCACVVDLQFSALLTWRTTSRYDIACNVIAGAWLTGAGSTYHNMDYEDYNDGVRSSLTLYIDLRPLVCISGTLLSAGAWPWPGIAELWGLRLVSFFIRG